MAPARIPPAFAPAPAPALAPAAPAALPTVPAPEPAPAPAPNVVPGQRRNILEEVPPAPTAQALAKAQEPKQPDRADAFQGLKLELRSPESSPVKMPEQTQKKRVRRAISFTQKAPSVEYTDLAITPGRTPRRDRAETSILRTPRGRTVDADGLLRPPPGETVEVVENKSLAEIWGPELRHPCWSEDYAEADPFNSASQPVLHEAVKSSEPLSAMGKQLFAAVEAMNLTQVEQLVAAGADVNETDDFMGWTVLHHAINLKDDDQRVKMVTALVSMGVNVDIEDMYQSTALHMAAEEGCKGSIEAMMHHSRNRRGSVEFLAQKYGYFEIADMLAQRWEQGWGEQPPPLPVQREAPQESYNSPGDATAEQQQRRRQGNRSADTDVRRSQQRTKARKKTGGGGFMCCGSKPKDKTRGAPRQAETRQPQNQQNQQSYAGNAYIPAAAAPAPTAAAVAPLRQQPGPSSTEGFSSGGHVEEPRPGVEPVLPPGSAPT